MIGNFANGILAMMLAKFMLNDIPHAAGIYGMTTHSTGYSITPLGVKAVNIIRGQKALSEQLGIGISYLPIRLSEEEGENLTDIVVYDEKEFPNFWRTEYTSYTHPKPPVLPELTSDEWWMDPIAPIVLSVLSLFDNDQGVMLTANDIAFNSKTLVVDESKPRLEGIESFLDALASSNIVIERKR